MRTFWACFHPLAHYRSNQDYIDNQPDKMNPQAGTMNPMNLGWKYFQSFFRVYIVMWKPESLEALLHSSLKWSLLFNSFHLLVYHTPVTHWEPVPGLDAKSRDGSLAVSTGTPDSVSDLRRQPGTQANLKVILYSYSIVLSATHQQLFSAIMLFTPYSSSSLCSASPVLWGSVHFFPTGMFGCELIPSLEHLFFYHFIPRVVAFNASKCQKLQNLS